MCFSNIAPVVCPTCSRTTGERAVSESPCASACGKFVSRPLEPSAQLAVREACAVCAAKEEERRYLASSINRHFSVGSGPRSGAGPGLGSDAGADPGAGAGADAGTGTGMSTSTG